MNREIKFRVRSLLTNKIVGYEKLMEIVPGEGDFSGPSIRWVCSIDGKEWLPGMLYLGGMIPLLREQFTGFIDDNKVDVYEKDILKTISKLEYNDENGYRAVIFSYQLGWAAGEEKDSTHGLPLNWGGYTLVEVVGDVYQNPELLNK